VNNEEEASTFSPALALRSITVPSMRAGTTTSAVPSRLRPRRAAQQLHTRSGRVHRRQHGRVLGVGAFELLAARASDVHELVGAERSGIIRLLDPFYSCASAFLRNPQPIPPGHRDWTGDLRGADPVPFLRADYRIREGAHRGSSSQ
jgi:hypothetical protein